MRNIMRDHTFVLTNIQSSFSLQAHYRPWTREHNKKLHNG